MIGELAVIGHQEHALAVAVEPADGIQAHVDILDQVGDALPAAFITHRREHAARLVEHDIAQLRLGGACDTALADIDLVVVRIDLVADLSDSAVNAYPARGDQFFTFSARSNAAVGEHFLQSN